jgi:hypothetical protein
MNIQVDMPIVLSNKVKSLFLTKKMDNYLKCLISVCLKELYDEDHDEFDFYKPMDQDYIIDVTSETFLKNCLPEMKYNFMPGAKNKVSKDDAIFHTDGSYKVGEYPMAYRINPSFIEDEFITESIDLKIDDLSLDHLFPEVINFYEESFDVLEVNEKRFNANLNEEIIIGQIGPEDDKDVVFLTRSFAEGQALINRPIPELFVKKIIIFGKVRLIDKQMSYVRAILKSEREQNQKYGVDIEDIKIIIDGGRIVIDNVFDYMNRRERKAYRDISKKINQIIEKKTTRRLSASNGRLNSNLTNLPRFAVKYLEIYGFNLTSFDLKSSQVIILANLMMGDFKFIESIRQSKYTQLNEYLDCFLSVDSSRYVITEFIDFCINKDIYQLIAEKSGLTRDMAKPELLKILYTEPGSNTSSKYDISSISPDFFSYLEVVKSAFKERFGSSKRPLSLFLQMIEAHIFIERIYTELGKQDFPAFTKHDSVLVRNEKFVREKTIAIIQQEFKIINFRGKIVEESYRSVETSDNFYNHPEYNMIVMNPGAYFPEESTFYDIL